jgi:3-methyladenine DNA glycosylase AlkD
VGSFVFVELIDEAAALLSAEADPERAAKMAAYMKTDMPFYGVSSPARRKIVKQLNRFAPGTNDEYRSQVSALWEQPHREEKYVSIDWARRHRTFITFENIDLYERMISEGAWWDLVDDIAANLVGTVARTDLDRMRPVLERWLTGDDLWLRRTVIICQLKSREQTDTALLFDACERTAHETDFFIRKAIGWALRQHSKIDPNAVRDFVEAHRAELSGLSLREATKHL